MFIHHLLMKLSLPPLALLYKLGKRLQRPSSSPIGAATTLHTLYMRTRYAAQPLVNRLQ
jgi:hypothetical protein